MTTTHWNYRIITVVSLACVLYADRPASAETQRPLSKQQVHKLLKTATTAADEQNLAAYYRAEGKRLSAKAREFASEAAIYGQRPAMMESKQGIACLCPAHFRYFAKYYAEEARKSGELAETHEKAAQR